MDARAASFLDLDDYFLIHLLEHLKSNDYTGLGALRLSQTCRRLRELSMPIFFSRCLQKVSVSDATSSDSYLVPYTLWPHIKIITLYCDCIDGDQDVSDSEWEDYTPQDSDIICGALAIPSLHRALRNMPRLSIVGVCTGLPHAFGHGLSWETLCSFLSLPQLPRLVLDRIFMCPRPPAAVALLSSSPTPLTCLKYILPNIREPYSRPSESEALDRVLQSLHLSLETLSLPTEPVRMDRIQLLDFPRLRKLTLRGLRWTSPELPPVVLFAHMPSLRVLVLELVEREGASTTALWPRGIPASFPWPHLESLSVSHPDPEDEIYAHLPPTMQTLMLRSWPHQCIRRWQEVNLEHEGLRPYRPPPCSSAFIRILHRCYTPHLRKLCVEYFTDYSEGSLLSYIASNFTHLITLELHRYRADRNADIPVVEIARPLASLSRLRVLKVHLDFPEMTGPMLDRYKRELRCYDEINPVNFEERLSESAVTFAQHNPCLRQVWHFVYKAYQLRWRTYHIVRTEVDGKIEITVETPLIIIPYETRWT